MMLEIGDIEFSEWVDKSRPGCTIIRGEKLILAEIAVLDSAGESAVETAKDEIRRLIYAGRI